MVYKMPASFIRKPFSLMAAGPRPCSRAALASDKTCYAWSYLPLLRLAPNPKRPVHRDWLEITKQ